MTRGSLFLAFAALLLLGTPAGAGEPPAPPCAPEGPCEHRKPCGWTIKDSPCARQICGWFTYRPLAGHGLCCCKRCAPCCPPPLYTFFPCRCGGKYVERVPCPEPSDCGTCGPGLFGRLKGCHAKAPCADGCK
jgi:hypothetical protein